MINAHFCTGVNTILPLPAFNEPGFSLVIEIHGKAVKYHLKPGSHIVIEIGVTGFPLPGVQCGGENCVATVVAIAKGLNQLVYLVAFFGGFHAFDFAYDFSSPEVTEGTAENCDDKKYE